ncbi:beta-N-acetylhexosaminidase [Aquirhabdus parva]|uniref:Beta-hexosaminidase n=1 Tax=Aquirhabdus parva TaxID=2283318 RepID=A0A345P3B1_9GAMM|nr:beta-N-acetylhexosaminidase [Aquirhabdus parva]AXI01770.1 beta-N-acetylhexosaminidase [Aquirhabdus parva]
MIGSLMLDIAGLTLTQDDQQLLKEPQVGGLILFGRNVASPQQVRDLTDSIRAVRPDILIAVDQEGGRVQRLRDGFTRLPAMGMLGQLYDIDPDEALSAAATAGWLMASEVLAVGIDFSFAPVLDVNGISHVIGDRGFHAHKDIVIQLSRAFMQGMHRAGMATTGKHFPGHGSVEADSHVAAPVDHRTLDEIRAQDMTVFFEVADQLDALMPAHVIYPQVDPNPAGFSKHWLQDIVRGEMGFDGVLFSDDLTMQAACVAGGAGARILAALHAGCDMGLVCNDRAAALDALHAVVDAPMPNQARLAKMRGKLGTLNLIDGSIALGDEWEIANMQARAIRERFAT